MGFLKNIFSKKDSPTKTDADFWEWFKNNERPFFNVVKQKGDIEKEFFDKLSPKLNELKDGYFYVTGMFDKETVELVFTADGAIKNIVFVEELVAAAPQIAGWKFTALKAPINIEHVEIGMGGYKFGRRNLYFYANEDAEFPDEIDITVVHDDWTESNKKTIANGTLIFLHNFLGELDFATTVDEIAVIGKADAEAELVPIAKLKDFLIWRQKEFIEKYEGTRHNTEKDLYSSLEAELKNGLPLIAIVNRGLLDWDAKASHPWILNIEIPYHGSKTNGMPDNQMYGLLNKVEEEISAQLKDADGYLNIGRETADSMRTIYFACNDFRKPSKILHYLKQKYANSFVLSFDIYKDKYWRTFDRFKGIND